MSLGTLFTAYEGRISRKWFWIGTALLVVVGLIIVFGSTATFGERDYQLFRLNGLVITIIFLYPLLAVWVKRLHDRGRPGYTVAIFVIPWVVHHVSNVIGITGNPFNPNSLDVMFFIVNIIVGIWLVVDLGILRGTRGVNAYGGDPLQPQQPQIT